MTLLHKLRILARKSGIEVTRYNPAHSQTARLTEMFAHHKINLVLDVGANDGGYGRAIRGGGYQGDILSFEPLEEPYSKLCNLADSDPHWQIAPRMALGSEDGEIEINVARNSTSSSILPMERLHKEAAPESTYVGKQRVQLSKLDSVSHFLISPNKKIFLKIDAQGYEGEVLSGAEDILTHASGIQLELSLVPLYQGQLLYQQLIDLLQNMGFSLWNIIPGFTNTDTGQMLQMDGVFFKP